MTSNFKDGEIQLAPADRPSAAAHWGDFYSWLTEQAQFSDVKTPCIPTRRSDQGVRSVLPTRKPRSLVRPTEEYLPRKAARRYPGA